MASLDNQGLWSKIDILKLLECMKHNIPSDDLREFTKSQVDLDWDKVAFGLFSGEMCKQKWMEISCNVRKFRTLTELVQEAKELMTKPSKNNTVKQHPDLPKRPLTAYLRFYKEQRAKYSQMYPKYTNVQLTKLLAEKYHQLPAEIKQRYIMEFKKEKEDFQEQMIQFRKEHQGSGHPKKSVVPLSHQNKVSTKSQEDMKTVKSLLKTELPRTFSSDMKFQGEPRKPPMHAYQKFHQDSWSSPELRHLTFRERWVEISRRWHRVPEEQRQHYSSLVEQLQKQYWVELELWLKRLSPEEYAAYKEAKATYGKRKNMGISGGRKPKCAPTDEQQSSLMKGLQVKPGEEEELLDPGTDEQGHHGGSQASRQDTTNDSEEEDSSTSSDSSEEEDSSTSSDSSSTDEDDENLPQHNPEV